MLKDYVTLDFGNSEQYEFTPAQYNIIRITFDEQLKPFQIAQKYHYSHKTILWHLHKIYQKINVDNYLKFILFFSRKYNIE